MMFNKFFVSIIKLRLFVKSLIYDWIADLIPFRKLKPKNLLYIVVVGTVGNYKRYLLFRNNKE